jgi:hypothetical protein
MMLKPLRLQSSSALMFSSSCLQTFSCSCSAFFSFSAVAHLCAKMAVIFMAWSRC